MGIKQLHFTFLRTRISSKKCPKVTFGSKKVQLELFQWKKCNGDFDSFGRKSALFLIYVLKDPAHSCDHFHVKIMVVGGCCVGGNNEKLNKLQFDCDVINDVTLMSHTSSECP